MNLPPCGEYFADRLTVSTSLDHTTALLEVQREYGQRLGATPSGADRVRKWATPEGGSLFVGLRSAVAYLEVSGVLLAELRAANYLASLVRALSEIPHRVTRLDATLDVAEHANRVLPVLDRRARHGRLSLGRKRVNPLACSWHRRPVLYEAPAGHRVTGSLYLGAAGGRKPDRSALVYDKRNERIDKGYEDPGPRTRYSANAGRGMGCSLADVLDPAPLFHALMSPDIMPRDPWEVGAWGPGRPVAPLLDLPDGPGLSSPVYAPADPPAPSVRLHRFLYGLGGVELWKLAHATPGGREMVLKFLDAATPAPPGKRQLSAAAPREAMKASSDRSHPPAAAEQPA